MPAADKAGRPRATSVLLSDRRWARIAQSGTDGKFRFEGVAADRYQAWALDDVTSAARAEPEWVARAGLAVQLDVVVGVVTTIFLVLPGPPPEAGHF